MATKAIGTKVVRLDGGPGYQGKTGEVVEATDSRVRVRWDDEIRPDFYDTSRPPVLVKGKRTWVKTTSVKAI